MKRDTTREMRRKRIGRLENGAVLIQGVLMLGVLVAVTVAVTLLLVNTGISFYYKQKLQLVTRHAAQYAMSLQTKDPDEANKLVANRVNTLLSKMGLPIASAVSLDTSMKTVSVTVDKIPLFGDGSILPANTTLKDCENPQAYGDCKALLEVEYDPCYNAGLAPGAADTWVAKDAYLPVLSDSQIDKSKPLYMLDSNEWPETHLIYHRKYEPPINWPNYR